MRVTSLTGVIQLSGPRQAATRPGLQPWSKAGLIITESIWQGSAYTAIMVTGGHEVRMQYNYTQDKAGRPGSVSAASPRWLRLTRAGDTLTGYDSADGAHWTKVGTAHLAGLPAAVQAGLFATSPQYAPPPDQQLTGGSGTADPTSATATFDRVSLHGGWPRRSLGQHLRRGQHQHLPARRYGGVPSGWRQFRRDRLRRHRACRERGKCRRRQVHRARQLPRPSVTRIRACTSP